MSALSAASEASSQLPSPLRRNWLWWSTQQVLQTVFGFWLHYRVQGLEHVPREGPALILSNHQSFLDPLLIGLPLRRPVSYLARHNLFDVPFVGWMLRHTYVMPIRRDAASTASIREMVRRLDHGFLVGMFPEGTRSSDGSLAELKPGFLSIIRRTSVPVLPVGIAGAMEALPRGAAWIRPARVNVVFGAPIPRPDLDRLNREDVIQVVTQHIEKCLASAQDWRSDSGGSHSLATASRTDFRQTSMSESGLEAFSSYSSERARS